MSSTAGRRPVREQALAWSTTPKRFLVLLERPWAGVVLDPFEGESQGSTGRSTRPPKLVYGVTLWPAESTTVGSTKLTATKESDPSTMLGLVVLVILGLLAAIAVGVTVGLVVG